MRRNVRLARRPVVSGATQVIVAEVRTPRPVADHPCCERGERRHAAEDDEEPRIRLLRSGPRGGEYPGRAQPLERPDRQRDLQDPGRPRRAYEQQHDGAPR